MKARTIVHLIASIVLTCLGIALLQNTGCTTAPTTQPTSAGVLSATAALDAVSAFDRTVDTLYQHGELTQQKVASLATAEKAAYNSALQAYQDALTGSSSLAADESQAALFLAAYETAANSATIATTQP
jgi:hypothetical protein